MQKTMSRLLVSGILVGMILMSCGLPSERDLTRSSSGFNAITAFSFVSPAATVTIAESTKMISVTVPAGTKLTALVANFTTTGISVKVGGIEQVSGTTPNDFTYPVPYIVMAENGSTATYTVSVTSSAASNSPKAITAFSFVSPPATGVINESAKTISAKVPLSTNVTALVSTFTITGRSVTVNSMPQISGTTPNNFTNPVVYTVTAQDGSMVAYAVTVIPTFCALPGPDQSVSVGSLVALDGSASAALNAQAVTYLWTMTTKPAASSALLSDSLSSQPTFTADLEGTYTVNLVINNGTVTSDPATVTITAYRVPTALNFEVIDAEYSKQLDKIVMVSASPANKLHIYDPVSNQDTVVSLNIPPTSVSVSPDGLFAAVGHNAWVSYVNLSTGTTVSTFPVSADVFDVVLAGNGYIYAFPRIDQWVHLHCIKIADGTETMDVGINLYAGTRGKLNAAGTAIYTADNGLSPSTLAKYDISGGTASYLYYYPYWGDYSICGDLWMSEDGLRIFTKCGNVFRSSPNRYSSGTTPEDMTYNGSFSNLSGVRHLSRSAAAGKVVVIPDITYSSTTVNDQQLQWYNYDYLTFASSVTLTKFMVGTRQYAGHGRFVFYNSAGTKVFVLLQADPTAGLLYDYGITVY